MRCSGHCRAAAGLNEHPGSMVCEGPEEAPEPDCPHPWRPGEPAGIFAPAVDKGVGLAVWAELG